MNRKPNKFSPFECHRQLAGLRLEINRCFVEPGLDSSSQSVIFEIWGGGVPRGENNFPNNIYSHERTVDFSRSSLTFDDFIALTPNGMSACVFKISQF